MESFIEQYLSPDRIYLTCAVLATLFLFLVSVLAGVTTRRRYREAMDRCRYRPRKHLMAGAERQCFQLLNDLFGQKFYVIPGVSLDSLLSHKVGSQSRYEAYRFIENKTVDFVLCNKRTLRPICAVKIDDEKRYDEKDPGSDPKDMEKFFKSAHIPFVRITKPQKLTRQRVIDDFSRVIYETSLLKPAPRGRRKQAAAQPAAPAKPLRRPKIRSLPLAPSDEELAKYFS